MPKDIVYIASKKVSKRTELKGLGASTLYVFAPSSKKRTKTLAKLKCTKRQTARKIVFLHPDLKRLLYI